MVVLILLLLFLSNSVYALDIDKIADFIVDNNPEIVELKRYESNLFRKVRIDARASVYKQDVIRDDRVQQSLYHSGQQFETISTGKRFEIILTIPILDLREESDRKVRLANFIATKRAEIVKIVAKLKSVIDLADYLDATLKTEKNELDWLKRRVEAGVEYQKDYNVAVHKYNQNLYRFYETVAQASELIEILASMVYDHKRPILRSMIGYGTHQAVPKN